MMSDFSPPSSKTEPLIPGIYTVINETSGTVMQMVGEDAYNAIRGFPCDERIAQQWQFERLGEGYSIRCVKWGLYLTVMGGLRNEVPLAASTFPVSWIIQDDKDHPGSFWISWPHTNFILDLASGSSQPGTTIRLCDRRNPRDACQYWILQELHAPALVAKSMAKSMEPKLVTETLTANEAFVKPESTTEIVVDQVEDGAYAITTTTVTRQVTTTIIRQVPKLLPT